MTKRAGLKSPKISKHIRIHADLDAAIDHVGKEFRSHGFEDHFLSERSVDFVRPFDFNKPLQVTGEVELSFFPYSDHIMVHYKIRRILGASFALIIPWMIYFPIFMSHLLSEGWDMPAKIYLPTFFFTAAFIFTRWYKWFWLTRLTRNVIRHLENPAS